MTTPKKHSSPMPDILWCIDNDFEQRYYRSPETLATAFQDGYYRPPNHQFPSRLVTYTRVDGDHSNALDPAVLVTILNKDRPEAERLWGAACQRGFKAWQKQTREKLVEAIRKTLPDHSLRLSTARRVTQYAVSLHSGGGSTSEAMESVGAIGYWDDRQDAAVVASLLYLEVAKISRWHAQEWSARVVPIETVDSSLAPADQIKSLVERIRAEWSDDYRP